MDEQFFSGSLLFSGVALLNWFTESSRFEEGFNDNELLYHLMIMSYNEHIISPLNGVIISVCTTSQEVFVTR